MSQGLVPISFSVGVAPEIILDGANRFIVHAVDEAKEKINILLENNILRYSLALNAKETARQFRTNIMIERMLALYRKILGKTCG